MKPRLRLHVLLLLLVPAAAFLASCASTPPTYSYGTRLAQEMEMLRGQAAAAVEGRETMLSMGVAVETDSAVISLESAMAGVRIHDGEAVVHGTVEGRPDQYVAVPFSRLRRLTLDFPLVLLTGNGRTLSADAEAWAAVYEDGQLNTIELYEDGSRDVVTDVIPVKDIASLFVEAKASTASRTLATTVDSLLAFDRIMNIILLGLLGVFTIAVLVSN
jgi:hypothetical protein